MSTEPLNELSMLLYEKTKAGKLKWTSNEDGYWPLVARAGEAQFEIYNEPDHRTYVRARDKLRELPSYPDLVALAIKQRDAWASKTVDAALAALKAL